MKNLKLKAIVLGVASVGLLAGSVWASPIYFEATNASGLGTINYGWDATANLGFGAPTNDAPEFTFQGLFGTVSQNLNTFTPGEYSVSVWLENFWVDYDNDGYSDFTSPVDITDQNIGTYNIPAIPAAGSIGQFSWNINLSTYGAWASYDFGTTGAYTNAGVNSILAGLDLVNSQSANGEMNAIIGWDRLRVELNSTAAPVPEPATMLLFGTGLLGLVGYNRKRFVKKS